MEPLSYQREILIAMQRKISHIYEGTADPAKVAKRRKKNKAARVARRHNR